MEDKIEVGEYVRVDKNNRFLGIGKIIKIVSDTIYLKMYIDLPISFRFEEIKEYKFTNEKLIIDIDKKNNKICLLEPFDDKNLSNSFVVWHDIEDINSIVTKEQFKYNCYEVKEA